MNLLNPATHYIYVFHSNVLSLWEINSSGTYKSKLIILITQVLCSHVTFDFTVASNIQKERRMTTYFSIKWKVYFSPQRNQGLYLILTCVKTGWATSNIYWYKLVMADRDDLICFLTKWSNVFGISSLLFTTNDGWGFQAVVNNISDKRYFISSCGMWCYVTCIQFCQMLFDSERPQWLTRLYAQYLVSYMLSI